MIAYFFTTPTMIGIIIMVISCIFIAYTPIFLINRSSNLLSLKKFFLMASIPCGFYLVLVIVNVLIDFPFPNIFSYIYNFPGISSELPLNTDTFYIPKNFLLKFFSIHAVMNILLTPLVGLIRVSYMIRKNGDDKISLINEFI